MHLYSNKRFNSKENVSILSRKNFFKTEQISRDGEAFTFNLAILSNLKLFCGEVENQVL